MDYLIFVFMVSGETIQYMSITYPSIQNGFLTMENGKQSRDEDILSYETHY